MTIDIPENPNCPPSGEILWPAHASGDRGLEVDYMLELTPPPGDAASARRTKIGEWKCPN